MNNSLTKSQEISLINAVKESVKNKTALITKTKDEYPDENTNMMVIESRVVEDGKKYMVTTLLDLDTKEVADIDVSTDCIYSSIWFVTKDEKEMAKNLYNYLVEEVHKVA